MTAPTSESLWEAYDEERIDEHDFDTGNHYCTSRPCRWETAGERAVAARVTLEQAIRADLLEAATGAMEFLMSKARQDPHEQEVVFALQAAIRRAEGTDE